ncbi:MAG: LCP family protein [Patescibacteria group bacterium]
MTRSFVFENVNSLKNSNGRTNFLVLGLGGARNEPSSLTDSQQFFSYDHGAGRHVLLSIPRDIWLPGIGVKINNAFSYGNSIEGSGIDLTKGAVTEITGQQVHYTVMIAFDGFVRLIDLLGGIDLYVDRSFVDTQYPIKGRETNTCGGDTEFNCRWETVSFKKGLNHFDGQTALKFVRSRHARGDEGTDLARAARQQKVLLAIKNKILSPSFFLNPKKVEKVFGLVGEVFESDIPQKDLGLVARAFLETRGEKIHTENLTAIDPTNPDENLKKPAFLTHPPIAPLYKNQWVLVPISGTWEPTHKWVQCLLEKAECPAEEYAPNVN